MPPLPAPPPPFPGVKPHLSNPALGVYVWFTDPPGLICRYARGAPLTVEVSTYVATEVDGALRRFFPGVTRFHYMQDFSLAGSYTTEARKVLTDWGQRIRKNIIRTVIIAPPMNAMFKMAVSAGMLALRLVGVTMESADSAEEVIARDRIRPAPGS